MPLRYPAYVIANTPGTGAVLTRATVWRKTRRGWLHHELACVSLFDAALRAMPSLGGSIDIGDDELLVVETGNDAWKVRAGRVRSVRR